MKTMNFLRLSLLFLAASTAAANEFNDANEFNARHEDDSSMDSDRLRFANITVGQKRFGKFLNLMQIVTFPNAPCNGSTTTTGTTTTTVTTGTKSGICYTQQECSQKNGVNSGSCASGFGVCCVFTLGCGSISNENCTYFDSSNARSGTCSVRICPCNGNICQLRLDFNTFSITGPVTATLSNGAGTGNIVDGMYNPGGALSASPAGQCLTDSFTVTSPGGGAPPTICGTNTGEHMYLDANQSCNTISFNLGTAAATGTAGIGARRWSIKISQYSCDYSNLAPSGCTQYFYGANMDSVMSFNYNNGAGRQLADQNQRICVRRERGNCRICFYAVAAIDFSVSGMGSMSAISSHKKCCSYTTMSSNIPMGYGFDCVNIPGASKSATNFSPSKAMTKSFYCGRNSGLSNKSVCTMVTPFSLSFLTDRFEEIGTAVGVGESNFVDRGFMLGFTMDSVGCTSANG